MGIVPKTCNELYKFNNTLPSGTYNIKPLNTTYSVDCKMTSDSGWTSFTNFTEGFQGFSDHNQNVTMNRIVNSNKYIEIANESMYQKVSITGQSESCCDTYGLKDFNDNVLFATRGNVNKILTFNINKNYANSVKSSFFTTDSSITGNGLSINSIEFK